MKMHGPKTKIMGSMITFLKHRTALRRLANRLETEKWRNEWKFALKLLYSVIYRHSFRLKVSLFYFTNILCSFPSWAFEWTTFYTSTEPTGSNNDIYIYVDIDVNLLIEFGGGIDHGY